MKRLISALLLQLVVVSCCFAHDHIIFRNGVEGDVKLLQLTDDKVVFNYLKDKKKKRHEVKTEEIYMIYIKDRGNIYIAPDGKRLSGEPKRAEVDKHDIIYLVKGGEIVAENIRISENNIYYTDKIKRGGLSGFMGRKSEYEMTLNRSEVFMIRYKRGMTDVITPIDILPEEPKPNQTESQIMQKKEDELAPTIEIKEEPQEITIIHSVAKGESLGQIAKKYNVTVRQIVVWNELPSSIKTKAILAPGTKLMINQIK